VAPFWYIKARGGPRTHRFDQIILLFLLFRSEEKVPSMSLMAPPLDVWLKKRKRDCHVYRRYEFLEKTEQPSKNSLGLLGI